MITPSELFFKFYQVQYPLGKMEKPVYSRGGVAISEIERYYHDPMTGILYISTKSMTEAYKEMEVKEGNRTVKKDVKVPSNVTLFLDNPDDIGRFFILLDQPDLNNPKEDVNIETPPLSIEDLPEIGKQNVIYTVNKGEDQGKYKWDSSNKMYLLMEEPVAQ